MNYVSKSVAARVSQVFVAAIFMCWVGISAAADFEFPVRPGDDAWEDIANGKERLAACQVPDDLLNQMSSAELLHASLDYPLLINIIAYEQTDAVDRIRNQFNGLRELLKRRDCGTVVMLEYSSQHREDLYSQGRDPLARRNSLVPAMFVELLLTNDSVLATLDKNDKEELVAIAYRKYSSSVESQESMAVYSSSVRLMGTVLLSIDRNYFGQASKNSLSFDELIKAESSSLGKQKLNANVLEAASRILR
jgi:hypothetical protein